MESEPSTMQQTTSSGNFRHSIATYSLARAKILFGCYRRGDANDPDAYVAAIAAVLSLYESDIIREVTDPRTGIAASEKYMSFMPNSGEMKAFCEAVALRRERTQRLRDLPVYKHLPAPPPGVASGDLASVFVPQDHRRYADLVEWSKAASARLWKFGKSSDNCFGIWVAWNAWDNSTVKGWTKL